MSTIDIQTKHIRFQTAPDFYGLFFEDINRSADGGLYPELLRNRAFEDSLLPPRCLPLDGAYGFVAPTGWRDQFNNGEGLKRWLDQVPPTPIPGWYAEGAVMTLTQEDTLNPHRLAALDVSFLEDGAIYNIGYQGVPLTCQETYHFLMFAKGEANLSIRLESREHRIYASEALHISGDGYRQYQLSLTVSVSDPDAICTIAAAKPAHIRIGFTSLMPWDTYNGHGMRRDLMKMLKNTHSKFLRFPGGCIVEGFTKETAMRFSNTVGPVWERPSQNLMWHYRTTNGLGFHEYLQICEDLHLEAMYVVNCGLTCQGRKPEYFEGEELDELLQEALDAIEYATGPADTKWGRLRAAQGHPAPFRLKYLEIGNENDKEVYFTRYEKFYRAIHERHPEMILISNTHTERRHLPTQIVDEHLYSTADHFVTAATKYEQYDRSGPGIFIGEYAVTSGHDIGNLKSALAETMYLMDAEKNQDVVRLTCYAPLFQHVAYTSWYPNLIAFDNHACYGIPFYYALSMLAASHGKRLLTSRSESPFGCPDHRGLNGILAQAGCRLKNVLVDGQPAAFSHGVLGEVQKQEDGALEICSDYINELEGYPNMGHIPPHSAFVTFGNEDKHTCTYELDFLFSSPDQSVDFAVWTHSSPMLFSRDETNPLHTLWNPSYTYCHAWSIQKGAGRFASINRFNRSYFGDEVQLPIRWGHYNHIRIVTKKGGFDCFLNGKLVQSAQVAAYPLVKELVSEDDQYLYVKVVNYSTLPDKLTIRLDCQIEPIYTVQVLTGNLQDQNSLEEPLKVAPVTYTYTNGASQFTYPAPAGSFNVLKLTKK